jgi:hypothetical protein
MFLTTVVADPDCVEKWLRFLTFSFSCFGIPGQRGGTRHLSSLASKINAAIGKFHAVSTTPVQQQEVFKSQPTSDNIAARVSAKLDDGDIRGAIQLASSDDSSAPPDDVTAAVLGTKHPAHAASDTVPPSPSVDGCLCVREADIVAAIKLFFLDQPAVLTAGVHSI